MIPRKPLPDPTYVTEQIDANPDWKLAFELSEVDNDHAPLGWGNYIPLALHLRRKYTMEVKPTS